MKKVKLILPALTEAKSPYRRPIKYSLFPPLGLATLAGFFPNDYNITIEDEHVEELHIDDEPDLVLIQVYITNAYRSYSIADNYRKKGSIVILGGIHVTTMPEEASEHADAIFIGPAEQSFPEFLKDFENNCLKSRYFSARRSLCNMPFPRRDLLKKHLYLVPNTMIVSRGCPHECSFCYKKSFFAGGKSFYVQKLDHILEEINSLPGKHLYFLDDHLFANKNFAHDLFNELRGMNRIFQAAATVDSILENNNLVELAAQAGLRSIFTGFESLNKDNLLFCKKHQNLFKNYKSVVGKLHSLSVMINASFVFGMDADDKDVFKNTVDWAVKNAIATCTFHILTPYPGTDLYNELKFQNRIISDNWNDYDTRHVVFMPKILKINELINGYTYAYREFYSWKNIALASLNHDNIKISLKHFLYSAAWKKFEPFWNFIIKTEGLNKVLPILEAVLSSVPAKTINKEYLTGTFPNKQLKLSAIESNTHNL